MGMTRFKIEKFDIGLWKPKIREILVQNSLEKAMLGKAKKPSTMSMEDFKDMDIKTLTLIQLSLSNEVLREVAKEETTVRLWVKLESLYMTKSVTNRLLLKSKLHDLRLEEASSIKSHLDEFESIIMDLSNLDVSLDDDHLAIKFLCSLPKDYKHFK